MIHTITFNPSLDYIVRISKMVHGEINRTENEAIYPGGKGINVSIVLSNLGIKSRTLGFIAGFTGREIENRLSQFGCHTDFIALPDGYTRINVKIKAETESEINGQGPAITEEALVQLFEKVKSIEDGDILILSGSVPNTLSEDIYGKIMTSITNKSVKIIVDATKDLLVNVLKYKPFLIKPNHQELGEIFGTVLHTKEEIIHYAKKLREMGAQNILVSMGGDGAVLLTEHGDIYSSYPPKGKVVNSVGAGDSMVAGFITGYEKTGNYQKALQLGIAAGSATAFADWLATKENIEKLLGTELDRL